MKRKLITIGLIFLCGIAFGQATKEAWRDFRVFIGLIGSAESSIQDVYNKIAGLESEKMAIMDDPARKAELKKIIDIHPDYTIESITTQYQKLMALKTWLENNGYIEEE